jgi:serine/threonine-protein kinase
MKICGSCHQIYTDDLGFCPLDGRRLAAALTESEVRIALGLADRFRIIGRLGEGGMGTVFLAEQIALGNRPVAIKLLHRSLVEDPEFLLRFHNEAASTARIHNPNVITVYESGQADDASPYIVMEYLEGVTLRQRIRERGAFPVPETVDIVQQTARGLSAAHRLGIIHRDLKPDNIFLTRGDEGEVVAKVMDFGIAKLRQSATRTLTGMVLGTPAYMSYEQASGMPSDRLDARSDVYSLGVVTYEMLTGRAPFYADTPLGYVKQHVFEEPPPFRTIRPGLPVSPEIEWVVMKALRKDREERYQTPVEFARDLAAAAAPAGPTMDISKLFPSIERDSPPPTYKPAEPSPQLMTSPATADVAVQTPPPTAVEGIFEPPDATPREMPPAPLPQVTYAPAAPETAPIPLRTDLPTWVKYGAPGVGLLAVLVIGIWYLTRPAPRPAPPPKATAPKTSPVNPSPADMISIPGSTFVMGRNHTGNFEESPAHSASVASFQLDKRPVTISQYAEFVKRTAHTPPQGWVNGALEGAAPNWPVTDVSWNDANAYCCWKGLRLPSEAEWEFAARGNDGRLYPWGNNFSPLLTNSREAKLGKPEAVGAHPDAASPFGVLDMSGNVWEWTADDFKPYPGGLLLSDIPPNAKVSRGGSYESDKFHVTTTARAYEPASKPSPTIGFRCAK